MGLHEALVKGRLVALDWLLAALLLAACAGGAAPAGLLPAAWY